MKNPYHPIGPIFDVNSIVGRRDIIGRMVASLLGDWSGSINLVGQNQFGKTSLLVNFEELIKKYHPEVSLESKKIIYTNLQEVNLNTPYEFFQA